MDVKSLLKRKITATYVTTTVTSIILAYLYMTGNIQRDNSYELGSHFLSSLWLYIIFAGAVILIYGNLVSIGLEFLQKKGLLSHTWIYVLLHGLFGSFLGFPQNLEAALMGMLIAIGYALVDRWLYARKNRQRSIKMFFLVPVLLCGILAGYFQLISEPLPPFTIEDAIESAGGSFDTDYFPNKVGKQYETINGYHLERETSAKEIEKETYLITFTERWEKGTEKGSWNVSYEMRRNGLTSKGYKGDHPSYYD